MRRSPSAGESLERAGPVGAETDQAKPDPVPVSHHQDPGSYQASVGHIKPDGLKMLLAEEEGETSQTDSQLKIEKEKHER